MKILLFGGSGQLGIEVTKRARDLNFEVLAPVTSEVNVSEREQVLYLANSVKPELLVNCAAYTAVDKAEVEREAAFKVNCDGAGYAAEAARKVGARFIHISTDYVFAGDLRRPLTEADPARPLSVYGESKLAGERRILELYPEGSLIVRTSSLHASGGVNFVNTMLKLFAEKPALKVVSDQVMSPTWAGWLAEVLLDLGRMDCCGLVHASCAGEVSWLDFAKGIQEMSRLRGMCELHPTTAAEFGRPAARPAYSVFDCSKLTGLLGRPPIDWRVGVRSHLRELGMLAER